jgi:urea-proton symporter
VTVVRTDCLTTDIFHPTQLLQPPQRSLHKLARLLTVLSTIVGGPSIPVGLILLWPRMSTRAVFFSPWAGFSAGLIAWFVVTQKRSGAITVTTTGDATNTVAGNVTSWGTGLLSAVVLSLVFPGKDESSDEGAVARANKINGTAPPRREAGNLHS